MLRKEVVPKNYCIKNVKYSELHNVLKGALVQCNEWAFKAAGVLDMAGFSLQVWRELFLTIAEYVHNMSSIFSEVIRYFGIWKQTLEEDGLSFKESASSTLARKIMMNAVAAVLGTPKDRFRKLYINCGALYADFRMDKDFIIEMYSNFCNFLPEGFAPQIQFDSVRRALEFIYLFCSGKRPNAVDSSVVEAQTHEIRRLVAEIIPPLFLWGFVEPVVEILMRFIELVRNKPFFSNLLEIFSLCYDREKKKKYGRERALLIAAFEEFVRVPSIPPRSTTIKPTEEEISVYYDGSSLSETLPACAKRSGNYEINLLFRYGEASAFQLSYPDQQLQDTIIRLIAKTEAVIALKVRDRPVGRGVSGFMYVKEKEIERMLRHVVVMPSKMLLSSSGGAEDPVEYVTFDGGDYVFLDFEVDRFNLRSHPTSQFTDTCDEFDAVVASSYKVDDQNPSSGDVLCVGEPVTVKCGLNDEIMSMFHNRNLFKKTIDPTGQLLYRHKYSIHFSTINRKRNVYAIIRPPVPFEKPVRLESIPQNTYQLEDRLIALILVRYALGQQCFPPNVITRYMTESDGSHFVTFDDFVHTHIGPKNNENAARAFEILKDEQRVVQMIMYFLQTLHTVNHFPLQTKRFEELASVSHYERIKLLLLNL